MIDGFAKEIEYLKSIGTDKLVHSDRSLLEHLIGTTKYLIKFKRSRNEQLAGLFHSIYGTKYYKGSEELNIQRDEIKKLIGNRAEFIVNIFCNSSQRTEKITHNEWFMEPWLTQLRWIEFANLLDQKDFIDVEKKLEKLWMVLNVGSIDR